MAEDYPARWEADVVLRDGGTATLRPIRPDDADGLVAFYSRVSDRSKYFRFFAPYPRLSDRDVRHFTNVDHHDRVSLVVLAGEDIVAVGGYDTVEPGVAEVAFLVQDDQQNRGLGSVLLEHLAQAARENGIRRFVAEVLPSNHRMTTVFNQAGYRSRGEFAEGVVSVELEIEPTDTSQAVMAAREHKAEAASVRRLLSPRSIVVVGAGDGLPLGAAVLRNLRAGGYAGTLAAVGPAAGAPEDGGAGAVAGPADGARADGRGPARYRRVTDVPGGADLAVLAVPADQADAVLRECAAKRVHGVVVVSGGFAETGAAGRRRQRDLVRVARARGLRVVGPNALGLVNTDPDVRMNATLVADLPPPGRLGVFCQSGAVGRLLLDELRRRGVGVSTFVSAGNRADVSGNDVLQYWGDDPATRVVALYLESIGNPRKFSRITRTLSETTPVLAVRSGRYTAAVPHGHTVPPTVLPRRAVDAMFDQSGVIRLDGVRELFDAATLLATQPLPAGGRVAVVGNSDALALLAADAAAHAGLAVAAPPETLDPGTPAADLAAAIAAAAGRAGVDAVVAVLDPSAAAGPFVAAVAAALAVRATGLAAAAGPAAGTPVALVAPGTPRVLRPAGPADAGALGRAELPVFGGPEDAVRAIAVAARYAAWRGRPRGRLPELPEIDAVQAGALVERLLADRPAGTSEVQLTPDQWGRLVACYGVTIWPTYPVATVDEALRRAAGLGFDVALKASAPQHRSRPDLADVWRNIDTAAELRTAWTTLSANVGPPAEALFVVQKMAPPGVPVTVGIVQDAGYGPAVSFGLAGVATDLLDDVAYRVPPVTDVDVAEMVREPRSAPMLLGRRGTPVDVAATEDLIHRMARLAFDNPEVVAAGLTPVLASQRGVAVLGGYSRLDARARPGRVHSERNVRRLTRL